ncbi:MAG: HD-GYP domain-containing protein [Lachnospiraceae bacterium]|nr:HD-GYP domain-containing protein [Lachnospiraceae bacterium]
MRLGQQIRDASGRVLIQRGPQLEGHYIQYLEEHGINSIVIQEGEEEEPLVELSDKAKRVVERTRVEDPAKVALREDVKKRVGEGVQFLYNNTESKSFLEATSNVSAELTRAITKYDAVAIDIAQLKVSDEYTFKHSVDVASLSMIIGKTYGLNREQMREIGIAGLLHDVGKSKIPKEILNKPARLTDEEFHQMKFHSLYGYRILEGSDGFSLDIKSGVLQHHEKMNGKGYPMAVGGDKIHPFARIISVADVYDALVTERPYKKGFPKKDAIEIIMTMTEDLDIKAMKSFLKSVILYPVDSIVRLSNGEYAKVVENYPHYPLRPKVVSAESGAIYDLNNDIHCQSILIL